MQGGLGRSLFSVTAGILPGGYAVRSGKSFAIWRLRPGGRMPPSTAARMGAATYLLTTVNAYSAGAEAVIFLDWLLHSVTALRLPAPKALCVTAHSWR